MTDATPDAMGDATPDSPRHRAGGGRAARIAARTASRAEHHRNSCATIECRDIYAHLRESTYA